MKRILLLAFFSLTGIKILQAQDQKIALDKIIGQVGNNIILMSDIEIDSMRIKYQADQNNQLLPTGLKCELLRQQIITKALEQQAIHVDSLTVSNDQLESMFQGKLREAMAEYGTKENVERAMGKSIDQFRQEIYPDLKSNALAQQEQQKITENVTITPAEVQAFFDTIPSANRPNFESQFTASQIVMYPNANQDVIDDIKKQLEDYKKQVEDGKTTFAALEMAYSDDKGTNQQGGIISIDRQEDKGTMDPDFMAAAFRLRDGQISPIVKSAFGYHLIQMVSRVGNSAKVRHILKIPPVSDVEIKATIERMDTLYDLLSSKKMDYSYAFNVFNEDKNAKFNAGAITGGAPNNPVSPFSIDDLQDKDLANTIEKMKAGEYSQPQVFTDPSTQKKGVRIIYLRTRTEPHKENMADDYDKISAQALFYKKQQAVMDWVNNHMQDFYIKIDPSYSSSCTSLGDWAKNTDERVEHFSAKGIK